MANTIELAISHRSNRFTLTLPEDTTFGSLQERLEELTNVPIANQKLLYKGKRSSNIDQKLSEWGLRNGTKVQLLGATAAEVGELKSAEDEYEKKQRILKERALKPQTKVRLAISRCLLGSC